MTQSLENVQGPPEPSGPEPPDDNTETAKEKLKVRVSLYYDGTQNNRVNARIRKNVEQGQGTTSADRYGEMLELFAKHGMKESSFDNDESNVSRLEWQSVGRTTGYDYYFHVYTEGVGTTDRDGDSTFDMIG